MTVPAGDPIPWDELRRRAANAAARAYAPYSRFPVGAAALTESGEVLTACNVENASYGLSLCAECGIVSRLHDSGEKRLRGIAVVSGGGDVLLPCGRCRQLLLEAGGPGLLVDAPDGAVALSDLLPRPFDAGDLER